MRGDEECCGRIAVRPNRRSARTGQHGATGALPLRAPRRVGLSVAFEEWGLRLHADLMRTHRRLLESAGGRRTTSRLPLLVDRLVAAPTLSAAQAAVTLGMTDRASRAMLEDLHAQKAIREVSGRSSFRVYVVV